MLWSVKSEKDERQGLRSTIELLRVHHVLRNDVITNWIRNLLTLVHFPVLRCYFAATFRYSRHADAAAELPYPCAFPVLGGLLRKK